MLKLNKGSIFIITETQFAIQSHVMLQPNCTERLHVDATIMRSFQTELFSNFLLPTYAGHVNLASAKHWQFMPNWKDGSTVEIIIFRVYNFVSASTSCPILYYTASVAEYTASVAEWLRAWYTLTMFEATVCGRS